LGRLLLSVELVFKLDGFQLKCFILFVNILNLLLRLLNPSLNLLKVLKQLILNLLHFPKLLLQPLIFLLYLIELSSYNTLGLPQCMLQFIERLLGLSHTSDRIFVIGFVFRVRIIVCKFNFFEIV
jgi:hypothetical protein